MSTPADIAELVGRYVGELGMAALRVAGSDLAGEYADADDARGDLVELARAYGCRWAVLVRANPAVRDHFGRPFADFTAAARAELAGLLWELSAAAAAWCGDPADLMFAAETFARAMLSHRRPDLAAALDTY